MSRENGPESLACKSGRDLARLRSGVALAVRGDGGDFARLLEDIDAEIARRASAGISRELIARMTDSELGDLRRAVEADMAGMAGPGNLAYGRASLASIDAELSLRTREPI